MKSGNPCYHSVQNLLSSRFYPKIKRLIYIYIYRERERERERIIILSVVLYRCKTWSLTLREERRLRVFENRVLRRIFGPKRNKVTVE